MNLMTCVLVGGGIYFVGRFICGEKGRINEGRNPQLFLFALLATIATSFLANRYGPTKPGSWFERSEYTAELYVNMFPHDHSPTNYRVPALIKAGYQAVNDYGDGADSLRVYSILKATFPNGGFVTFGDHGEQVVKLGSKRRVTDNSGNSWSIELTSEAASEKL